MNSTIKYNDISNEISEWEYSLENEIYLTVEEVEKGERKDGFLVEKLDFTRTRIQNLIKEGHIRVNEKKIKPSYKVEKNDIITGIIPKIEEVEIIPENIHIDIIYEDKDIAVINKQAGLVVHPAQGHYSGTLVNAILWHIKDLSGINGELRPGIVHRLDKDTSGLLIIAKNDRAHINLTKMFQEKKIKKTYLAILKGKLQKSEGRLVTQIGRDKNDRKRMAVINEIKNGKTAITNYKTIFQDERFTLVKVNIETGRTHQIRVHMKYLGYPILGDSVYGRKDSEKRQMLHAYKLEFFHPVTSEPMKFIGKIPEDFTNVLEKMDFNIEEMKLENE